MGGKRARFAWAPRETRVDVSLAFTSVQPESRPGGFGLEREGAECTARGNLWSLDRGLLGLEQRFVASRNRCAGARPRGRAEASRPRFCQTAYQRCRR